MNPPLKVLSLLFVFVLNFSYAQKNRFDVGIEGGPNLSTLLKEEYTKIHQLSIFGSAGTFFQYNCKKIISFKTGVFYQRKGYKWKIDHIDLDNSSIGKGKFTSHWDYLTLPLLTKVTFGKKINFFVNAGPYIAFLLQKTEQLKTSNPNNSYKYQDIEGTNRFDFGFTGGLGLGIPIKEKWLITIEARNYSGITDIVTYDNSKLYTNTTDINIGFVYKMGLRDPVNETSNKPSKKDKPQIDIGIEGGPNLNFFIQKGYIQKGGSYPSTNIPTIFASTGLTFQYNFKKIFSIRTGLYYQQKGYHHSVNLYNIKKETFRFDYLTIPILARFTFGKKVQFFVNVGVFGSFLAGRLKKESSYQKNIIKWYVTNPPNYNAGDAGFTGGLGIALPIKKHWLISLEARNYSGVLDITNKYMSTITSPYKLVHTNTSDLLLGVSYKLGFREEKNK